MVAYPEVVVDIKGNEQTLGVYSKGKIAAELHVVVDHAEIFTELLNACAAEIYLSQGVVVEFLCKLVIEIFYGHFVVTVHFLNKLVKGHIAVFSYELFGIKSYVSAKGCDKIYCVVKLACRNAVFVCRIENKVKCILESVVAGEVGLKVVDECVEVGDACIKTKEGILKHCVGEFSHCIIEVLLEVADKLHNKINDRCFVKGIGGDAVCIGGGIHKYGESVLPVLSGGKLNAVNLLKRGVASELHAEICVNGLNGVENVVKLICVEGKTKLREDLVDIVTCKCAENVNDGLKLIASANDVSVKLRVHILQNNLEYVNGNIYRGFEVVVMLVLLVIVAIAPNVYKHAVVVIIVVDVNRTDVVGGVVVAFVVANTLNADLSAVAAVGLHKLDSVLDLLVVCIGGELDNAGGDAENLAAKLFEKLGVTIVGEGVKRTGGCKRAFLHLATGGTVAATDAVFCLCGSNNGFPFAPVVTERTGENLVTLGTG